MEKTELRDAIARYVQKFGEESKKVQQRLNEANSATEVVCVPLINGSSLASNILELQNSDCFTDVCINCSDGYFYVHSGILMAASQPILTHFLKTNDPENFDANGRRHLDLKTFSVVETASVLFLFYTGSSMHHILEDSTPQRHEDSNGGNHKVLMKILARFGTNTSNLVMSVPVTGSTFPSRNGNPVSLRFCRKDTLQKTTEDFLISQEGEIRPAPPVKLSSLPSELITPAAMAEDCNFCPIVCTPTSSRKVHLEDCKYAISKKNNEDCKAGVVQRNGDDNSTVKATKMRNTDNQDAHASTNKFSAESLPSTNPKSTTNNNETKISSNSKGPSVSLTKTSEESKTSKPQDYEVIFIKPEPPDTVAAFEQLNATKVNSITPQETELPRTNTSPAVVTPVTVEDKPKAPPIRKEPQLPNIRRTFNDCQGATVKRKKPTEGGIASSRDKLSKENKNNRPQIMRESSSDSEYEEPRRPKKRSYIPSSGLNKTEVRSPVVVLTAKDIVRQKYGSPKALPPQRSTKAGPPTTAHMKTLNAVANGMRTWAASKGGPRK